MDQVSSSEGPYTSGRDQCVLSSRVRLWYVSPAQWGSGQDQESLWLL